MKNYDFKKNNINTDNPGFYNDPSFLELEKCDPSFLNEYNRYVTNKTYTEDYLINSSKKIKIILEILEQQLEAITRKGICIDICQVISKIFESENIWCCTFSGSMTISFNKELNLPSAHFWSIDNGTFDAAHSWIYAPPFNVIDISLNSQQFNSKEKQYIPKSILEKETKNGVMKPIDLINPAIITNYLTLESVLENILSNPSIRDFINDFPPIKVENTNSNITYFPIRAGASDGELKDIKSIKFGSRYAIDVYEELIKPQLNLLVR